MPDKEYAETYETRGKISIMVIKEYSGIRLNFRGGEEMFVAASPDDARAALSYFIDTVPPDALRAIADAEATESDRRKMQEIAGRLPKRIKTAMAANSVFAGAMFIVVFWMVVQLLPDVNVRDQPQTLLSKVFGSCLIASLVLGFELLGFGYYYGNHVEFLITRLTGRIDALNKRISGPPSSFNIYSLKEYRGLMIRNVLVGGLIIGAVMLVATLVSIANPPVDAVFVLSSGVSSALMAGGAGYLLYKRRMLLHGPCI
jgi:hypothetical protein